MHEWGKVRLDTIGRIFRIRPWSTWPCGFMLLYPGTQPSLCQPTWQAPAHP